MATVPPSLDRLAAYAWRLIAVAVAGLGVLYLVGRLQLVLFPLVIAVLLTRALEPVERRLARRIPGAVAAAVTLLGFLALLVGTVALLVPVVADEFADLGPTMTAAVDDIQEWIVDDSGIDVTERDIERGREQLVDRLRSSLNASSGAVAHGAVLVAESIAGLVIALFLTFFLLKDGERFQAWSTSFVPDRSKERVRRLGRRSWDVLGGYLRGAALLGLLEGVVMAVAVALVGGSLAIPVAVLTFLSAFVPFVGALVAGLVAVLVTLATAGVAPALIVTVVAVVLQQLDNDLLAPVIYGRSLQLHPAAIILAVAAGGALFGLPGTFLAVPVAAVIGAVGSDLRDRGSIEVLDAPGPGPD